VATAAGMFLMLSPLALLGSLLLFLVVVLFSRYVSLGSIAAAAAMLIVYKHDANIQRLVEGREPRFSLGNSKGHE